jgi:TonB family protein
VPAAPPKTATDAGSGPVEATKAPTISGNNTVVSTAVVSDAANTAAEAPKSDPSLQTRIERARALIAAHRLETAASELESVRATAQDSALRNITSIMLMNVYLEEGNYGRAEALLEENFKARSTQKDESLGTYFALAGQAVNGARTHLARYRTFGINTNDVGLPAEAVSDLNRLRSLLERMIMQAKDISSVRRAYDSLSLLEDVVGLRLGLAQGGDDQARWESEYVAAHEALASSQTQVASLGGIPPLRPGKSPAGNPASPSPYSTKQRGSDSTIGVKTAENDDAATEPSQLTAPESSAKETSSMTQPGAATVDQPRVTEAGSLNARAAKKVLPVYPSIAKKSGAAGLVRVHVIVDESGKVIEISRSEGPMLLRQAAEEAARQWSFSLLPADGRPARISGYIDFNFSL